jgi:cytochrome d ubiquinol oxidase subunit II
MDLNTLWFILLGVLLAGYAILDGFDLGVGILHLAVRKDEERRVLMNAIGPVWDGNEVWLLAFGGAMFAAFPHAYATVFSGFYTAFMLLLVALIARAVSIEFRGKRDTPGWRGLWDRVFFGGSAAATLLFGVATGNVLCGLPIGADKEFQGGLLDLLRPFPLLVGVLALATFTMHGALYLLLKTDGDLQQRVRGWFRRAYGVFVALYLLTTVAALFAVPLAPKTLSGLALRNFHTQPALWAMVALNVLAIVAIPIAVRRGRLGWAFLSSCVTIAAFTGLFGAAMFPELAHSSLNPSWSLDIYNAASSAKTLRIMTVIAGIGMPLVLLYTAVIYRVFRGKVRLDATSY